MFYHHFISMFPMKMANFEVRHGVHPIFLYTLLWVFGPMVKMPMSNHKFTVFVAEVAD